MPGVDIDDVHPVVFTQSFGNLPERQPHAPAGRSLTIGATPNRSRAMRSTSRRPIVPTYRCRSARHLPRAPCAGSPSVAVDRPPPRGRLMAQRRPPSPGSGPPPRNSVAEPRPMCLCMSAFNPVGLGIAMGHSCAPSLPQSTRARAAISSATLCEVPPGKRRSDSINTLHRWRGERTGPILSTSTRD